MVRTRQDVYAHGNGWSDTLHWYAIGVRKLRERPVTDNNSWMFLAGIHGFSQQMWEIFGYLNPADPLPTQSIRDEFWSQCQHGSWYFLPWHRGYLSAYENILMAAIRDEGGPSDWALPYWNYSDTSNPDVRKIHPVFTQPSMPDGTPNALFTPFRFGNGPAGDLIVPAVGVTLDALKEPRFGSNTSIAGGFGGGKSPVSHRGNVPGELEFTPHGNVHTAIGGRAIVGGVRIGGLMSAFPTAGLDPIFWVHHCNIDRLWDVWLSRETSHKNPDDVNWTGGPLDKPFVMPKPGGGTWQFACIDVIDTTADPLEYVYDDISDPFGDELSSTESFAGSAGPRAINVNWEDRDTELLAAYTKPIQISAEGAKATVVAPDASLRRASERMMQESVAAADVERFFLFLEDIRGSDNVGIYQVFVDYGAEPGGELLSGRRREFMAGTFSTFGIDAADSKEEEPSGFSRLLNITPLIAQMGFDNIDAIGNIHVKIVPVTQAEDVEPPTIHSIGIYREMS